MSFHKNATGINLHTLVRWTVADAAAKAALTAGLTVDDEGKLALQEDTDEYSILRDFSVPTWVIVGAGVAPVISYKHALQFAVSDEVTPLIAAQEMKVRNSFTFDVTEVRASLTTAQATGGTKFTVDIKQNGTTILTTLLTFDNTEKTTFTAAVPAVLDTPVQFQEDDEITAVVSALGDGTACGLKVAILGTLP